MTDVSIVLTVLVLCWAASLLAVAYLVHHLSHGDGYRLGVAHEKAAWINGERRGAAIAPRPRPANDFGALLDIDVRRAVAQDLHDRTRPTVAELLERTVDPCDIRPKTLRADVTPPPVDLANVRARRALATVHPSTAR